MKNFTKIDSKNRAYVDGLRAGHERVDGRVYGKDITALSIYESFGLSPEEIAAILTDYRKLISGTAFTAEQHKTVTRECERAVRATTAYWRKHFEDKGMTEAVQLLDETIKGEEK